MKKIMFIAMLSLALVGCGGPPVAVEEAEAQAGEAASKVPVMENIYSAGISDYETSRVYVSKTCDNGRAIYITSDNYSKPGGIAIVEDAKECKDGS